MELSFAVQTWDYADGWQTYGTYRHEQVAREEAARVLRQWPVSERPIDAPVRAVRVETTVLT